MAAATGLMWHEVALIGTTAHEFEQQITDLQPFLSEHWRVRINPRSGNPINDRPEHCLTTAAVTAVAWASVILARSSRGRARSDA
jgi:hypothetical protein